MTDERQALCPSGCVPEPGWLAGLLRESAARHQHLCPRQVLGVRLGLRGLQVLGLIDDQYRPRFTNRDKRLITIVETDGCGADGLSIATGCDVGRRTLRVLDFGKLAATLVDTGCGRAVRVTPSPISRALAERYAPQAASRWHAYLEAYQIIPDAELVQVQEVRLTQSLDEILSKPDMRAICDQCGEEIVNERELYHHGQTLCRSCAGEGYYRVVSE
jgi:formylmethanofuran dehydrogenase subunit E